MSNSIPAEGLPLDILGQQPLLKIYTQICLCYPLNDDGLQNQLVHTLKEGLSRLTASFPWIAGQVTVEGASENHSGIAKIIPFEATPPLIIKDLRQNAWSYAALQKAKFPFRMLDESVFCPRNTLPGMPGETDEQRRCSPVLYVQASFVAGGLILAFVAHHAVMDMTGQGHVIHMLSKACRMEAFSEMELVIGNPNREDTIQFLDESWQAGTQLDHQLIQPLGDSASASPPPHCTWAYFSFSKAALAAMKARASDNLEDGDFVSTDDVLTAFIWQATMRAGRHRLDPSSTVSFARAVDVRNHLGISPQYPGLVQNMTYHSRGLQNLVESQLSDVAREFRRAVDSRTTTLEYDTRALATMLHRMPDKTSISLTATLDMSRDIALSSWAKVNCYDLDFGLDLGLPEAVRRPQFTPVEGLMYIMPKDADGELVLGVCLRDDDLDNFKADDQVSALSTCVG